MKDLGIDPSDDIGGRIENDCFICGFAVLDAVPIFFKGEGPFMPRLPIHKGHFDTHDTNEIAAEYHRRVHDLAGVPRTN